MSSNRNYKQKVKALWKAGKIQMGISIVSIIIILTLWVMAAKKIFDAF